jgi:hypothetical protein
MSDWGPALDIHRALLLNTIPDYISGGEEPVFTPDPCSSKETLETAVTSNGSVASVVSVLVNPFKTESNLKKFQKVI